jgi:hypothetical protein
VGGRWVDGGMDGGMDGGWTLGGLWVDGTKKNGNGRWTVSGQKRKIYCKKSTIESGLYFITNCLIYNTKKNNRYHKYSAGNEKENMVNFGKFTIFYVKNGKFT